MRIVEWILRRMWPVPPSQFGERDASAAQSEQRLAAVEHIANKTEKRIDRIAAVVKTYHHERDVLSGDWRQG